MLLQTTHHVTKKSGAAHMKSILSGTASQAMSLMIGSGPNVNSKRSPSSHETGIVFTTRLLRFQMLKLPFRTLKRGRHQVDDLARDFGKHGHRSPRGSCGHIHSPVSQDKGAGPTRYQQTPSPVRIQETRGEE